MHPNDSDDTCIECVKAGSQSNARKKRDKDAKAKKTGKFFDKAMTDLAKVGQEEPHYRHKRY